MSAETRNIRPHDVQLLKIAPMLWARPVRCQRRPARETEEQLDREQPGARLRRGDLPHRAADAAALESQFLHRARITSRSQPRAAPSVRRSRSDRKGGRWITVVFIFLSSRGRGPPGIIQGSLVVREMVVPARRQESCVS